VVNFSVISPDEPSAAMVDEPGVMKMIQLEVSGRGVAWRYLIFLMAL
jgi:hypothetical protein